MSKKPDRSSRKADLPDWADEVTPADEVMEKFYAPTGVFRHGPISTPQEPAEASPDLRIESREDTADPQTTTAGGIGLLDSLNISAEDNNHRELLPDPTPEFGATSGPTTVGPDNIPDRSGATTRLQTETSLNRVAENSPGDTLTGSQNILFAEFANKWRRYLYPGQLAVMRALYESTFPHGTSECFTRYSEIAASTKMSRRNCINVMNSLVERGFVERLEIRNDASGKGIRLRIHLDPLQ